MRILEGCDLSIHRNSLLGTAHGLELGSYNCSLGYAKKLLEATNPHDHFSKLDQVAKNHLAGLIKDLREIVQLIRAENWHKLSNKGPRVLARACKDAGLDTDKKIKHLADVLENPHQYTSRQLANSAKNIAAIQEKVQLFLQMRHETSF